MFIFHEKRLIIIFIIKSALYQISQKINKKVIPTRKKIDIFAKQNINENNFFLILKICKLIHKYSFNTVIYLNNHYFSHSHSKP